MEEFRKDARNVKLRIGDHFIEDVTDVLKRFFREIDDPIFMADLHPLWQEAASESTLLYSPGHYGQVQRSASVQISSRCSVCFRSLSRFHLQKSPRRVRGWTATKRSSGVFLESTGPLWLLSSVTCTGELALTHLLVITISFAT